MGIFNFFGEQEHRVFNYKPIYYNQEEDERRQKFGKVDGTMDKEMKKENYVPGSSIQGSLRDGRYKRSRTSGNRAQNIIGLVGLLLVAVVLIYIARFYSLL
ncbi:MAG: hypothetical protein MJY42_03415 [Bacteroidales bacterium]|nr:hypothetical protein [Bacteroidales bacterium]